jgi:rhodanese-related sulfurtransferase
MNWLSHGPKTRVDAHEALELLKGNAVLVDVREPDEWRAGHAPVATHIPMARVGASMTRLPRGRPVIVVCRSGRRSLSAVKEMREAGHDALNLSGGMQAWQQAGGAVVRDGGTPGMVI